MLKLFRKFPLMGFAIAASAALIAWACWPQHQKHAPFLNAAVTINGGVATGSSGDTVFATLNETGTSIRDIAMFNGGTVAGQFTIDGGTTWLALPAGTGVEINFIQTYGQPNTTMNFQLRRIPSGTDVTGITAYAL
jgi:hypothetical protein